MTDLSNQKISELLISLTEPAINTLKTEILNLHYDERIKPIENLSGIEIANAFKLLVQFSDNHLSQDTFNISRYRSLIPRTTQSPLDFAIEFRLIRILEKIQLLIQINTLYSKSPYESVNYLHQALNCRLKLLNTSDPIHLRIIKYAKSSRIIEIYKVTVKRPMKPRSNNLYVFWHGSRNTNWYNILCTGLKVPPADPTATCSSMFGRGIYFADRLNKSLNYAENIVGLFSVDLGNVHKLIQHDYTLPNTLPAGKHSVWGLGMITPDEEEYYSQLDVDHNKPTGNLDDKNLSLKFTWPIKDGYRQRGGCVLNYNEFVVYDKTRVQLEYLVKISR